jgi:ABC-type nitrate/sulfonate/bicarbonate transport system substrate-binding protein
LGVAMNTTGYSVVTRPEIGAVADLKGKTLGIGRGRDLPYIHLSKLLRDSGFDPKDDVKWLALGGSDAGRLAMLKSGVIHGTVFPATADLIAVKAGMKILKKLETPALAGGIHSSSIFVQKNRDSLRRFLEGYIEGIHYMINHKDESVIVFSKVLKNSDLNSVAHLYDEIGKRVQQDLRPNPESVRFFIDLIAVDYPQAQRLSEKDYWDLSLLDEIQRSGFVQRLYRK